MKEWSSLTYQYYNRLYRSSAASAAGIQQLSVFYYSEELEVTFPSIVPA
jgi:hypothetical protein